MLNWIKTVAICGLNTHEVDNEDFPIGFELSLPPEMQEFLSKKTELSQHFGVSDKHVNPQLFLDEHELALS